MKTLVFLISALFLNFISSAQNAAEGDKIFNANCKTCHSIGKGKVVGPDLKNVQERRKEEWLLGFIKSPAKAIKAEDPIAVKLFEENNKILMPDHSFLSDADIKNIIAYITEQSKVQITASTESNVDKNASQSVKKDLVVTASSSANTSIMDYIIYALLGTIGILLILIMFMGVQVVRYIKN